MAGLRIKSRFDWLSGGNRIDMEGFNGLAGGRCSVSGFADLGKEAVFWTATEDDDTPFIIGLMVYCRGSGNSNSPALHLAGERIIIERSFANSIAVTNY